MKNRKTHIMLLDTNDFAYGHELFASIELIDSFDGKKLSFNDINIDDVIELYIACQYVSGEARPTQWTDEIAKEYKDKAKSILTKIARYFKKINGSMLISIIDTSDTVYHEEFWRLYEKYKCYISITQEEFEKVITLDDDIAYHSLSGQYIGRCQPDFFELFGKGVLFLVRYMGKDIPHEVYLASLPGCSGEALPDRADQPGMRI